MNPSHAAARGLISVLLCLGLLATPGRALALATEHFGNDPVPAGFVNLYGPEAIALANLTTRVYWYEINGNPTFFYEGDAAALNEALKKFAALPGGAREVVLLLGHGEGHSLIGDKKFGYDWWINTPAGEYREGSPRMTVYVGVSGRSKPATNGRFKTGHFEELQIRPVGFPGQRLARGSYHVESAPRGRDRHHPVPP